jgi:hypothetical protein
MRRPDYTHLMVCTDCYFAHHYGRQFTNGAWYAGENDQECEFEPLAHLNGMELADNTNSDTGEGIEEFSRGDCDGCDQWRAGSRYRLAGWRIGPSEDQAREVMV